MVVDLCEVVAILPGKFRPMKLISNFEWFFKRGGTGDQRVLHAAPLDFFPAPLYVAGSMRQNFKVF